MPRPKTVRRPAKKGGKTKRIRGRARRRVGGATPEEEAAYRATWAMIDKAMEETEMKPNLTVNPESKFVVVTYWWGRGNTNRNLQLPCPEDILDEAKEAVERDRVNSDPAYKTEIYEPFIKIRDIRRERLDEGDDLTEEEQARWEDLFKKRLDSLKTYFGEENPKKALKAKSDAILEERRTADPDGTKGTYREPKTYDAMIANWEDTCKKMKCNYLAVEFPQFAVSDGYQAGINAKPSFIRKALEVCEGRGVLYIDGDMFIKTYPKIFDLPNIDFGARSWNADPRASPRFKTDVCFDPYIFETSGGTMFFANNDWSKRLLTGWEDESRNVRSKGKADDRILSQVFTLSKAAEFLNVLHLPIEYLWLTDYYAGRDFAGAADESKAIITHPYCLTGEERAQELSASSTSRHPEGYSEYVEAAIACTTRGGIFYEYIFFPSKDMVDAYGPYLQYMRTATNPKTGETLFEVVDFDDMYGPKYSATAQTNLENAKAIQTGSDPVLKFPTDNPTIPQILAGLLAGKDISIRGEPAPQQGLEFSVRNISKDPQSTYLLKTVVDTNSSMYISGKNPVIMHLIAMCRTLEDINMHLQESFLFFTRIRWSFRRADAQAAQKRAMERGKTDAPGRNPFTD